MYIHWRIHSQLETKRIGRRSNGEANVFVTIIHLTVEIGGSKLTAKPTLKNTSFATTLL
jgi:hypothetical protein